MRSKANIKGHPLHPILIPFPIAFLTGTLLFDVLGQVYDREDFLQTATYLQTAGILFALLAAIPGIIDYINTVPPKSSAKKRGALHGLTNTTMVIIFTAALFYKRNEGADPIIFIGLEALGTVLLSIAGWLGGTLVYRNQIGVDPRYAEAGKWKELHIGEATGFIEVAQADELKVNQMKLVHTSNKRIVIARTEEAYVAFDDRCTHKGGSLAGGAMMCGTVQCPWHGSQFNVRTGALTAGPGKDPINTYTVEEREGKVYLKL